MWRALSACRVHTRVDTWRTDRGKITTYKGYQARVELDEEAAVFHGEVVNTRDVITFQGSSVAELKHAFEDSIDDYLDFCASRGEDPASAA